MNKFYKIVTAIAVVFTVGLTYGMLLLKGMPDVFDWEEDDE